LKENGFRILAHCEIPIEQMNLEEKSLVFIKYPSGFPLESLSSLRIPSSAVAQDGDILGSSNDGEFVFTVGPLAETQQVVNLFKKDDKLVLGKPFDLCVNVLKNVKIPDISADVIIGGESPKKKRKTSEKKEKESSKKKSKKK
jgi:hypothetical protein